MLSVTQASNKLYVTPSRVRKLIADGRLKAVKTGRTWSIPESEVARRLEYSPKAGRPRLGAGKYNQLPKCIDLHDVYMELKSGNYARPSASTIAMIEDKNEAGFIICVYDYFLNIKQREEIEAGVY